MHRLYCYLVPVVVVLSVLPLATLTLVVPRVPVWSFLRDSPSGRVFFDSARHFPLSSVLPNETKFNPTNANVYQNSFPSWVAPAASKSTTIERAQEEQVEPSTSRNQTEANIYVAVVPKEESDRRTETENTKSEIPLQGNNYPDRRSYSANPLVDEVQFFRSEQPLIDVRSGAYRGENRRSAPLLTTTLRPPSTFNFDQSEQGLHDSDFEDLFRLDDFKDIFNSEFF